MMMIRWWRRATVYPEQAARDSKMLLLMPFRYRNTGYWGVWKNVKHITLDNGTFLWKGHSLR